MLPISRIAELAVRVGCCETGKRSNARIGKQVTSFIRDGKWKVTTQIQGDAIRVTGKSRDDLQSVIAAVRGGDFPVALQF